MLEILHKLLHNITNCLANFQIYRDWCKIIALKSNQSNIYTHTHTPMWKTKNRDKYEPIICYVYEAKKYFVSNNTMASVSKSNKRETCVQKLPINTSFIC